MDRGLESEANALSALGFPQDPGVWAGEGQRESFLPRAPLVSPQRSRAAMGLGETAKNAAGQGQGGGNGHVLHSKG